MPITRMLPESASRPLARKPEPTRSAWRKVWAALRIVQVRLRFFIILAFAFVVVGKWDVLRAYWEKLTGVAAGESAQHAISGDTEYFCPMCPGVLSDWPSKCPVCNMALVRRKKGEMAALPDGVISRMQFSPYRIQLGGIRTSPIEFHALYHEIRGTGIVEDMDEKSQSRQDLRRVAVRAEFFEKDFPFLSKGQVAECSSDLLPGHAPFAARIVSLKGRSANLARACQARIEVENPQLELRAGMVVDVKARVPIAHLSPFAKALDEEWQTRLFAEWIRTLVGSVRGPAPGTGIETLLCMSGRRVLHHESQVPAVPESAVIDTGMRKIVYVESAPGTFDGVEVTLGPRIGDSYPVVRGLQAGQRVATAGAFLIDAETRLNPSIAASYFGAARSPAPDAAPPGRTAAVSSKSADDPAIEEALSALSPEYRALARTQKVCPVTGQPLGSMGTPTQVKIEGRRIFLCCEGCESKLKEDPKKYLAKLNER